MPHRPVYALLAAGRATRMGFAKAFAPLDGIAPLARIAQTLGTREFVVVTASADLARAKPLAPNATAYACNDEPERGMSHSLRRALALVPADRPIGVLLADMPFVSQATLAQLEARLEPGIDVVSPVDAAGNPGHPVLFATSCRTRLESLGDGDTIRTVRNDPALHRVDVPISDRGAFIDLDRPSDWHTPS